MFALTGGSATIDESVFTVVVNGAKAVLGLFTEFPINIFLATSIMGVGLAIAMKLKRS